MCGKWFRILMILPAQNVIITCIKSLVFELFFSNRKFYTFSSKKVVLNFTLC